MRNLVSKYCATALSLLLGVGVFLFWWRCYPHALSYQEQYQLFLCTPGYLSERLSVPGGLADWVGECVVQFYYVDWLGALLLASLFVFFRCCVALHLPRRSGVFLPLSFVPPLVLLWFMGDVSVLLSFPVALMTVLAVAAWGRRGVGWGSLVADLVAVAVLFWTVGGVAWLFVGLRVVQKGWRWLGLVPCLLLVQWAAYMALPQWPAQQVFLPMTYYRIPLQLPWPLWGIPLLILVLVAAGRLVRWTAPVWAVVGEAIAVAAGAILLVPSGYDREMYALIRQDYLVRHERWDDLIREAQDYQVRTPFSSVCVNLALSQKHLLADRMFDFYQSGPDALIMPRVRDLTSMLPSMECFWRLGMINSCQRYAFDSQASILNGRRSGRLTRRIAECMLANGHYAPAEKHLALLAQSLFYRRWARRRLDALRLTGEAREQALLADEDLRRVRSLRFKDDFLFSGGELDKMLAMLFSTNKQNRMALDYFLGQLLLEGNVPAFQQYLPWAQQYGGYRYMPLGYQDVMRCVQANGAVSGSPYGNYVKRKTGQ